MADGGFNENEMRQATGEAGDGQSVGGAQGAFGIGDGALQDASAHDREASTERDASTQRRSSQRPSVKASGARMATSSGQPRPSRTHSESRQARRSVSSRSDAEYGYAQASSRSRDTSYDYSPDGLGERQATRSVRTGASARQGEARHHLLRNTTYDATSKRTTTSSRQGSGASSADGRPSTRSRAERASRASGDDASRSSRFSRQDGGAADGESAINSGLDAAKDVLSGVWAKLREVFGIAWEAIDSALSKLPFPKSYVAIVLGAILLAIIIAVGVSTCSAPQVEQSAEVEADQQEAQQQEDSAEGEMPEELQWRDSDFAVDPSRTEWKYGDNGTKTVYLTIDDGPSELTEQYLDLFDRYNVKATFFVTGHDPEHYGLIREAYKRGHTIGLHSMTHDYAKVYASEDAYYDDLDAVGQVVKDQIGYVPCFIRFPGGSSNTQADSYSKGLMEKLVSGVQKLGYQYYDWNVANGDGADLTKKQIIETVKEGDLDTNIILLAHDSATKQTTLDALPEIIEYYQGLGYTFAALDRDSWVCHHALAQADDDNSDESANAENEADDADAQAQADDGVQYEDYEGSAYDEAYDAAYDGGYDEAYDESYDAGYDDAGYYEEDAYADEGAYEEAQY